VNPRQRVHMALNHQEPDRLPIDLGSTLVTSISLRAYQDLLAYLGLSVPEIRLIDYVQQLPFLDERLLERFDVDLRMVQLPAVTAQGVNIIEEGDNYVFYNRWGARLQMPKDGGLYFDYVDFPIKTADMQAVKAYAWPESAPPGMYAVLGQQAEMLYRETEYSLVGGVIIGGGIFEQPARLMGFQNFFMALIQEPQVADYLMEKMTDLYIQASLEYLEQVGALIDVFVYWDDVCGQNGWLIHPDVYLKRVKPRQRRLVEAIKSRTGAKLFYHGDGAVADLIPHLIEIGFDIVNPVQVSARGMDTRQLKRDFGSEITFWGGGIDTQQVLPFGTPEQVRDEVRRRIDDLAPGGGFIFAPVHNIQPFVPPENIVTAYETAHRYGWYHPT
jgi:uroporphyrinogen decarboxylase